MKIKSLAFLITLQLVFCACQAQTITTMQDQTNPLLCNPTTGLCEIPAARIDRSNALASVPTQKTVKIIYFTDPICSSCWGIEAQLRKLKLEYGSVIDIDYRMGGLLPNWSYNSGGISKPADVAVHWDQVSAYYDMPIDGYVWLEDPLPSSYPPSIAFKAAQLQDEVKALLFMRELRELVFLHKKNITKWEHIEAAALLAKLDVAQLKKDYEDKAKLLFNEDLQLAAQMGVRGFPTLLFSNAGGQTEVIYGAQAYTVFEATVKKLAPESLKMSYDTSWQKLFTTFSTLTAKEFSELSGMQRQETEAYLEKLCQQRLLKKFSTKNGSIWQKL